MSRYARPSLYGGKTLSKRVEAPPRQRLCRSDFCCQHRAREYLPLGGATGWARHRDRECRDDATLRLSPEYGWDAGFNLCAYIRFELLSFDLAEFRGGSAGWTGGLWRRFLDGQRDGRGGAGSPDVGWADRLNIHSKRRQLFVGDCTHGVVRWPAPDRRIIWSAGLLDGPAGSVGREWCMGGRFAEVPGRVRWRWKHHVAVGRKDMGLVAALRWLL